MMAFVKEGWEDGPTCKRELQDPAVLKKDSVLFIAYAIAYFIMFLIRETLTAFVTFLKNLIFRPEPKSLKGRVCLVTGTGRGLGRQFCLALAKEGAIIACVDINEPNNKTTASMIKDLGGEAVPYTANVAIKKDVEELVDKVEKEVGPIYLLINNAAIVGNTYEINEILIRAAFNVNVFGPIWVMNAVLPYMKLRNEGHIVNMCSIATKMTISALNVYGATKVSLSYISNCIRAQLQLEKKKNIIVTNVHPSIMNSSEDYVRCVPLKINIVVEMEEVVKETMTAIHYGHEEVVVPSIMKYPLILINDVLPSLTTTRLLKLIVKNFVIPSEEQYECLPWVDIAKECCFMEDKNDHQD